jgi:hexosaminidase
MPTISRQLLSYGDENNGKEWNANPTIQQFMKENSIGNKNDLQTYFNMKLIPMLKKHDKKINGLGGNNDRKHV